MKKPDLKFKVTVYDANDPERELFSLNLTDYGDYQQWLQTEGKAYSKEQIKAEPIEEKT